MFPAPSIFIHGHLLNLICWLLKKNDTLQPLCSLEEPKKKDCTMVHNKVLLFSLSYMSYGWQWESNEIMSQDSVKSGQTNQWLTNCQSLNKLWRKNCLRPSQREAHTKYEHNNIWWFLQTAERVKQRKSRNPISETRRCPRARIIQRRRPKFEDISGARELIHER